MEFYKPSLYDQWRIHAMNNPWCLWDDPDDPDGNVQHIIEHGLTIQAIEEVMQNPSDSGISRGSGRPCVWGYTAEGLYIFVVYDKIEEDIVRVVTAYVVPEPRS